MRPGANALDHAITTFTHVRLPRSALLGDLNQVRNKKADFFDTISRVSVGTLAISMTAPPTLLVSAYIVAQYSKRRVVKGPGGPMPIIEFRTQLLPILRALSQGNVLKAFAREARDIFTCEENEDGVRSGVAVCFKAVCGQFSLTTVEELTERCGAQGLFQENQLMTLFVSIILSLSMPSIC